MKNLYTLLILLMTVELFSNELSWVDEQINAIKPARVGVSSKEISRIKNPFIFLDKPIETKNPKIKEKALNSYVKLKRTYKHKRINFRLDAILNKAALINGKWYKEGSYIYSYKIAKVNRKTVLLVHENKNIFLSTEKKNKKIKINNK